MDAGLGQSSTSTCDERLALDALDRLAPIAVRPGRNATKAEIRFYRWGDREIAVKDYRGRPWPVSAVLGRWLVAREARAYAAAGDLPGIPRFLGRLGPATLAVTRIHGQELAHFEEGSVPASRFDALAATLARLHDRGVALADLGHRDVLLDDAGGVWVLDLAMAWTAGAGRGWRRALFERFRRQDQFALARLRARYTGSSRGEALERADPRAVRWHRRARRAKYVWDRLRGAERLPPIDDHWRFGVRDSEPSSGARWAARARILSVWIGLLALLALARPRPADLWLGLPLVAGGEALRWWAAGHLVKSVELVTSGPYAYLRNPLYLGRLSIFTGLCAMARLPYAANWIVWAIGLVVWGAYYMPRKERVEPQRLEELHGESYRHYRAHVRSIFLRFVPYERRSSKRWSWRQAKANREPWMVVGLAIAIATLAWRAFSSS